MIKSNELRIGNLVFSDFSETNFKTVVEIKHKMASVKYIRTDTNEPHQSMVDYERLVPIELTEELLLKSGAKKKNHVLFMIGLHYCIQKITNSFQSAIQKQELILQKSSLCMSGKISFIL